MLVHNQTKHAISFDYEKRTFRFEPYGPCEVPEMAFVHMKLQRFPVSIAPVPAPTKAAAIVDSATEAARGDEIERLKNKLTKVEAEAQSAKQAATAAEVRRDEVDVELQGTKKSLTEQTERAHRFEADLKACEEMLSDTARKLEESEGALKRLQSGADAVGSAEPGPKSGTDGTTAAEPKAPVANQGGGGGGGARGGGKGQQQLPPQK